MSDDKKNECGKDVRKEVRRVQGDHMCICPVKAGVTRAAKSSAEGHHGELVGSKVSGRLHRAGDCKEEVRS